MRAKNTYTDNVIFNICMIPIWASAFYYIFKRIEIAPSELLKFLAVYIFCSAFFQPDLDVRGNRPGKKYFPLGQKLWNNLSFALGGAFPLGRDFLMRVYGKHVRSILMIPFFYINRIWYYFWAPFTYLVTHRGISHWPVIGVWVRSLYMLIIALLLNTFLDKGLGIVLPYSNNSIINFFYMICGFNFETFEFMITDQFIILFLPIYLSDFTHSLIDMLDSLRNGTPFCSFRHPPGIFRYLYHRYTGAYKAKKKSRKRNK